jgi:methylenetetrahydrofolate dehydrogenase (NADP+) / methenyltetrahydrofolate cyclohydrolase
MQPAATTAKIIDGRDLARRVRADVARRVGELRAQGHGVRLDAILAEGNEGADIYAHSQARTCAEAGIEYVLHRMPANAGYEEIAGRVLLLNADDRASAIMVHLPLPDGVDTDRVQSLIDPEKDVEGVNPANIGNVVYGRRSLVPCTALAVMEMIESTGVDLRGRRCLVVGQSNIVGKPIVVLLMAAEATVLSTNVHTQELPALARTADVLISATGVAGLVTREWINPGAVVIDVGISRIPDKGGKSRTVGDVRFEEASQAAGWISPVPGGVGPMTVAMLLRNTVDAAER